MPTAVTRFDFVKFPVTFYLDVIAELKRFRREELINSIDERRESIIAMYTKFVGPEFNPANYGLLDVGSIDRSVAAMYEVGNPYSTKSVGEITVGKSTWKLESLENVFTEMRQDHDAAAFTISAAEAAVTIDVREAWGQTEVTIVGREKAMVQKFTNLFSDAAPKYALPIPEPERPRVFIGHGGSSQWQSLHIWLRDQMGYDVEAFETLPRAGHTIKEALDGAMANNNVAILVMTAEDQQADTSMRARQNVVHETGLFQGRLGFHRTIILLEEGTDDYSNLAGVQELRYPAGQIRATYGDIIATLQREFPS